MIDNKKRVLFISTKSVLGGAQRYIVDLVDYLPKDFFDMSVAAGGKGPLGEKIRKRNIPFYEINDLERNLNPFKDLVSLFLMMGLIRKVRPDILHLNSSKAAVLGGIAGKLLRVPKIISSTHGWPFLEDRPKWQRKMFERFTKVGLWFQDKVICVSQFDYEIGMQKEIAPAKKLVLVHNGIDPKKHVFLERAEARNRLFAKEDIAPNNKRIIGTIAEYTKNKGLFYLIEAAQHLLQVEPDTLFMIIGWGEEREFLKKQITRHGLEKNIYLINYLPEAFTYLKAFDVFVLPSLKEGFAYTLLEASLAECPIVTTRVGGNPEIVENLKTGLLIRPASPEEIINAVVHLIRDPQERTNLGRQAREKVARDFAIYGMVEMTQKVYLSEK
ncbi:MAG: glycosyltransferase family 4 protein [bacterium]|nr:glycosyltransferase family 4 protein [bacterium]